VRPPPDRGDGTEDGNWKDLTASVASHRKPKQRNLTGSRARTAATLAIAGAASVTTLTETGHADPQLTSAQARAKADRLYEEAETATESYNGAKEKADTARTRVERLQDELARRTARLNTTRNRLGYLATAQYRSGGIDPALQLAMDSRPDDYLARARFVDRMSSRQRADLDTLTAQQREVKQLRQEADGTLTRLRATQHELAEHKRTIEARLAAARKVLSRLPAADRAPIEADGGTGAPAAPATGVPGAPSVRAARAVSFAYGALGLPYVWGATGPSGYDCSGLTQAAWRAAGVALPRTTYTQINSGARIAKSQLRPGDLVFFYSGISHVGLYIGNGQMIHAPHSGAPVRIAPIDQMPFAGAARPV
jgi:cell wall-associated NlpC family hydrolase